MGTLRIKRGTKTALQTNPGYTPAEGELVYTTDSKEVFVGDGATVGGTPVSVSTQNLEDLGNVQALAAQQDQILVYNGSNWAATDNPALDVRGNIFGDDSTLLVDAMNNKIVGPIETTSITSSGNIVGDVIGDVTGSVTGNVVGDSTGTHFGNVIGSLEGHVVGSIFSEDSTLLVDADTNKFQGTFTGGTVFEDPAEVEVSVNIDSTENTSKLNLKRISTSDLSGNNTLQYGTISFGRNDANGLRTTALIFAREQEIRIGQSSAGAFGTEAVYITWKNQKLGIGKADPQQQLDMSGNAVIDGTVTTKSVTTNGGADSFIQFGSVTTTQRDALTAANGMVIYNSSTNKFQGYENGAWVNLV